MSTAIEQSRTCYPRALRLCPHGRGPLAAITLGTRRLSLLVRAERGSVASDRFSYFEVGLEIRRNETDLAKLLAHQPLVMEFWLPTPESDDRFAFTYTILARVEFTRFREIASLGRRGYSATLYGRSFSVGERERPEIPGDVALPPLGEEERQVSHFTTARALSGPPFDAAA